MSDYQHVPCSLLQVLGVIKLHLLLEISETTSKHLNHLYNHFQELWCWNFVVCLMKTETTVTIDTATPAYN